MTGVFAIDGSTSTPQPVPLTLVLTSNAHDVLKTWSDDPETNLGELNRCLLTLVRMGGRGWMEGDNLIVFETPHLTIGMFRDSRGSVSLNS